MKNLMSVALALMAISAEASLAPVSEREARNERIKARVGVMKLNLLQSEIRKEFAEKISKCEGLSLGGCEQREVCERLGITQSDVVTDFLYTQNAVRKAKDNSEKVKEALAFVERRFENLPDIKAVIFHLLQWNQIKEDLQETPEDAEKESSEKSKSYVYSIFPAMVEENQRAADLLARTVNAYRIVKLVQSRSQRINLLYDNAHNRLPDDLLAQVLENEARRSSEEVESLSVQLFDLALDIQYPRARNENVHDAKPNPDITLLHLVLAQVAAVGSLRWQIEYLSQCLSLVVPCRGTSLLVNATFQRQCALVLDRWDGFVEKSNKIFDTVENLMLDLTV